MNFFKSGKSQKIEVLEKQIAKNQIAFEIQHLGHKEQLAQIQNNITTLTYLRNTYENQSNKYQWNKYLDYAGAVEAIYTKSAMVTEWGTLTGPLVEIRAALIGGHGIDVLKVNEAAERELGFTQAWLKYNSLDNGRDLTLIEEAEKEGRICLRLIWDEDYEWTWTELKKDSKGEVKETIHKETGMVKINFFNWYKRGYTVEPKSNDEEKADKILWDKNGKKSLKANEFAYRKFRGMINDLNQAVPKVWSALSNIDRFDETEFDLYLIDRLFASPVPVYSFDNAADTRKAQATLENYNFKIRKAVFLTNGKLEFVGPQNTSSIQMLIDELKTHVKVISGKMQIPTQFLGFSEDVKNKNVSENLMEGVNASIQKDRQTYEDCFVESLIKSMLTWNNKKKLTKLNPVYISLEIGAITTADWNRIKDIFLPAAIEGKLSRKTLWEKMPGIDANEEEARATVELAEAFQDEVNSNERTKTIDKTEEE